MVKIEKYYKEPNTVSPELQRKLFLIRVNLEKQVMFLGDFQADIKNLGILNNGIIKFPAEDHPLKNVECALRTLLFNLKEVRKLTTESEDKE